MGTTRQTKTFIGAMILVAAGVTGYAGLVSHRPHGYLAVAILALAGATSRLKVKLPGINGSMSVNLPFLLAAIVNLSSVEAVLAACVSTVVQCWPRRNTKFRQQQMIFNLGMMAFATSAASLLVRAYSLRGTNWSALNAGLALATAILFLGQTVPVAGVVAVSERKSAGSVWWHLVHLSFPYYVLSAGITSMAQAMSLQIGWGLALAVFPVMYGIYRSYRLYFGRLAETLQTNVQVRAAGAGAGA